jgi:hypothetical protein
MNDRWAVDLLTPDLHYSRLILTETLEPDKKREFSSRDKNKCQPHNPKEHFF